MKKFNPNKRIIIALIIAIVLIFLISFTAYRRNDVQKEVGAQSLLNDTVAVFDRIVNWPVKTVQSGVSSIGNLISTFEENATLKKKVDSIAQIQQENRNYKRETEDLKKQLKLQDTLTNYDSVTGTVINRSPNNWEDMLVINKGTADGVKVNMPVMGNSGLVGRVLTASRTSSKVELLTSANQSSNHFPVAVELSNGALAYGLLQKYDEKTNTLVVTQLTSTDQVSKGAKVSTSGLGGNSPAGLVVGTVSDVKVGDYGLAKEVYVKPQNSMDDISSVTVIKRLVGSDD